MGILFGHPTGSPLSHHAALAHWERGRLEAFCVPWMPTPAQLRLLQSIPGLARWTARLRRRSFHPLLNAPRVEGRCEEWRRMVQRIVLDRHVDGERLSNQANQWVMRTMKKKCRHSAVSAVHSYEDCSLWAFEEARRLGKKCIYDMPIGYYPAWKDTEAALMRRYSDWLPPGGAYSKPRVSLEQKVREMEMADLVLAPCSFAARTIESRVGKKVRVAPYGVDLERWFPADGVRHSGPLRFLYAGHISIRKGLPLLFKAWEMADLSGARLDLVGSWHLAESAKGCLAHGVRYVGHCSPDDLRKRYQLADLFVFPSYFEGFGLVIGEAMACGLPVLASDATAGPDVLDDSCGRVFPAGDLDALVECLRFFNRNREKLPAMRQAAHRMAKKLTWKNYRVKVSEAVADYC